MRSRRLVFSAKVSALAVGSDSATRGRTFLITGGRYVSLHSGGVLGLAPPAKLEEYMADARWASLETRRLLPKSDGLYLYIWTMTEANTKTTQTRSQRKVSRGRERQERG